ncbi:MAG: hypothetical protein QOF98_2224, partial [Streptomyces sp.]|nr:hypothetical protein [Streptomyces sp.]
MSSEEQRDGRDGSDLPDAATGAAPDPAPALELVIFDCDGVLVDSEKIAVRMDAEAFAELGWRLTEHEVLARFVGRSHG